MNVTKMIRYLWFFFSLSLLTLNANTYSSERSRSKSVGHIPYDITTPLQPHNFRRGEAKLQQVLGSNETSRKEWTMPHEDHSSSFWDTVNNPYFVMVAGYFAHRIIPPMIDYASNSVNNLYVNYWLTQEEQEKMEKEQEAAQEKLILDYEKAVKAHFVLLNETERGKNILLKEKEQEIRHNNTLIKCNEVTNTTNERKELSKTLAQISELKSKTVNPEIHEELQKKLDYEITKWAKSK
jgi:hypothetical protein